MTPPDSPVFPTKARRLRESKVCKSSLKVSLPLDFDIEAGTYIFS